VRVCGGAGPSRRLPVQQHPRAPAFLVSRGCSSVPRGISGIARPPRPTPPAKKPHPAASSHPQPTGPPPASLPRSTASSFTESFYLSSPRGTSTTTAWDARSTSSSPELGYDNDFISTPLPAFDWTQANVNICSSVFIFADSVVVLLSRTIAAH
jgi:hypothetical protein